jgi:cytochrome c-type biogenesis protein CcmF
LVPLGAACLIVALPVAAYAVIAALTGRKGDRRWVDSSRRAIYALCALLTIAVIVLEAAFLRDDFSVDLVADHSSTTTPVGYKLTAMWSSQAGSLLLWAWVLSIAASAVLFGTRRRHREVVPWATAVLGGLAAFFVGLMLFGIVNPGADSYPFARLDPAPAEGVGLNPLLRHPAMAIHPPMLYSGYVLFSIPFAFAVGALIARRLDASWIRSTRRFALIAWTFLTIGVLLGARWSYSELGWGGYWGWDAVENASLMPWLVGTAFLHSVMVQERRGMLKVWNVSLIVTTFTLCLLGTFLVRSGVLESIHAFGVSKVGGPLLALIAVVLLGSVALIVSRLDDLRSERRIDSLLSRESIFLVNNLLLVGLCVVVFWGTFFPLISEAVTGTRSSVGTPFFNRVVPPLAILLVLFTGIGPLVAWRQVSWEGAWRIFRWPVVAAAVVVVALVAFSDARGDPLSLALFACAAFTLAALVQEFAKAVSVRRALAGGSAPGALLAVIGRNRRRYGGYIVHAGIAIAFIAVAASSAFQTSRDLRLSPGDSATVGDYEVTYTEPTREIASGEQRLTFGAVVDVTRDGEHVASLEPSRNYYSGMSDPALGPVAGFFEGETTSEVGRRDGFGGDVWVAMQPDLGPLRGDIREADERIERLTGDLAPDDPQAAGFASGLQGLAVGALAERYATDPPPANFRVNVNPLVVWIWIGGGIGVCGALIALWPSPAARRRRVADVQAARLARELGRAEI